MAIDLHGPEEGDRSCKYVDGHAYTLLDVRSISRCRVFLSFSLCDENQTQLRLKPGSFYDRISTLARYTVAAPSHSTSGDSKTRWNKV